MQTSGSPTPLLSDTWASDGARTAAKRVTSNRDRNRKTYPTHSFMDFLSKSSSHEDSDFVGPLCKVAFYLASVFEGLAKCFVVNDVSPSSARAEPCCNSATCCIGVLAVASVTWARCWINTASCCCCIAICKSWSYCLICATSCSISAGS